MPEQTWYQPPDEFSWDAELLATDVESVLQEESKNTTEKKALVPVTTHQTVLDQIRQDMNIVIDTTAKTIVVLVIMDTENKLNNVPKHIHCGDGIGLGGYVKDVPRDAYLVDCVDFLPLGTIPIAFTITVPKSGGWQARIPMPEKVVDSLLSSYYKRVLKSVRGSYPRPRYEFHYMQMLDCQ